MSWSGIASNTNTQYWILEGRSALTLTLYLFPSFYRLLARNINCWLWISYSNLWSARCLLRNATIFMWATPTILMGPSRPFFRSKSKWYHKKFIYAQQPVNEKIFCGRFQVVASGKNGFFGKCRAGSLLHPSFLNYVFSGYRNCCL